MEYRLPEIKEYKLEDVPVFYKSTGGNPYVTRLDSGIDVGNNMFENVEIDEFRYEALTGSATITRTHDLRKRPFIFGTYKMTDSKVWMGLPYPDVFRGNIPENRVPIYGLGVEHIFYISYVDKDIYKITYFVNASSAVFNFKINLLRETTV